MELNQDKRTRRDAVNTTNTNIHITINKYITKNILKICLEV